MRREALYENDELPKDTRDVAALLASKVYYYLGEYDESLSFALGAGGAFEVEARTYGAEEYVETIVCETFVLPTVCLNLFSTTSITTFLAKAIDRYIQLRCQEQTGKREKLDPRLQTIIESIFKQCIDEGDYTQVCRLSAPPSPQCSLIRIGHWHRPRIASA
jgi:26S proteasome regulatory subunit N2